MQADHRIMEGLKINVDLSTYASEPPTHPPNVDKHQKKYVVFGLFSSFGTKKMKIFQLENFSTLISMNRFS